MAVRTDITLERAAGGPPIEVTVGPDTTSFAITQSTQAALPFSDKSHEPVKNSMEAVSQLASILKKEHSIDTIPGGSTSVKVAGTDMAFAVMAAKLFQVNGAIGEDQVDRFEAKLKAAERVPEPVVATATEQSPKPGISSQLESIRTAMAGMVSGMQTKSNGELASSKETGGLPVTQVAALNQTVLGA